MALPAVLAVVGLASDYAMMTKTRQDLRQAADAAAIAGAREIPLARSNSKQVASAARSYAAYRLTGDSAATDSTLAAKNLIMGVEVVDDFSAVEVTITEAWTPFFLHFIDYGVTPLTVTSTARFIGRNNICVLGLDGHKTSVHLDKDARLTGNNCGVFSNSTDKSGLEVDSGAAVTAQIICSAGGANISSSATVTPEPVTDCPPVGDPLAERAAPGAGTCDQTDLVLDSVKKTINPGVYCGGLTLKGSAYITLNPGVYVIKDGALDVTGTSCLTGEQVGFFITGDSPAAINFTAKTHISLTAPKDGPLSGLLIFEDRAIGKKLKHKITSDDARVLLGTIYLPVGSLTIDAKQPVADQSAYTAIVARSLELDAGPNLVLNADYGMTDVPVPAGIAGSSQVVLSD
jgi:hypothetical protein